MKVNRIGSRCFHLVIATALVTLVSPARARPRDGTVAIVSIEITGDAPAELRTHIQRNLAGGLAAGGLRVVELNAVMDALSDTPELIGCRSTTCLQRIGEKVGAGYFVRARVEATGSAYFVEIELLSANVNGGLVTRTERSCPVCTVAEVNDLVSAAAKAMVELPPAKPVPVRIVTTPSGAVVRVDEAEVGKSPHEMNLGTGEHIISAVVDGHARVEKTVTVTADGPEPQVFELILAPVGEIRPPTPHDDGGRPYRTWKWITAGAAASAVVTGIALVVLDDGDTCTLEGDQKQCPEVYDTKTSGVVSLGVGAAIGGISAWMFIRDRRDRRDARKARVSIQPTRGGAIAGVTVKF